MKTKKLYLILSILFGILTCSCSERAYTNEYFLHNTTGHDIIIVNTKSNIISGVHKAYDSTLVQTGEYYPLYLQSGTKDVIDHDFLLNVESRLYIYNNDTCFYIHPGDSSRNCLWSYVYRKPSYEEETQLSATTKWALTGIYIYDLTDENIQSEVHRP